MPVCHKKLILFSLFTSMLLAGCSQAQEDKVPVIVSQAPSPAMGSGILYPSGFPVPQYPGSKIATSTQSGNPAGTQITRAVVLTTTDDIYKIGKFYETELMQAGWQITHTTPMESLLNMEAIKGNQKVSITASSSRDMSIPGQSGASTSVQIVVIPTGGHGS